MQIQNYRFLIKEINETGFIVNRVGNISTYNTVYVAATKRIMIKNSGMRQIISHPRQKCIFVDLVYPNHV